MLPAIKAAGCKAISFDYADRLDHPLVERTLPFVDYGFYSYHKERDAFIEGFLIDKVDRGMKIAVATFGDKGSLAYDGRAFTSFGIFPAPTVVNTVAQETALLPGSCMVFCRDGRWKTVCARARRLPPR